MNNAMNIIAPFWFSSPGWVLPRAIGAVTPFRYGEERMGEALAGLSPFAVSLSNRGPARRFAPSAELCLNGFLPPPSRGGAGEGILAAAISSSPPGRLYYTDLKTFYRGTLINIAEYEEKGKVFDPVAALKELLNGDQKGHSLFNATVDRLVRHLPHYLPTETRTRKEMEAIRVELEALLAAHGFDPSGNPKTKAPMPAVYIGNHLVGGGIQVAKLTARQETSLNDLSPAPEALIAHLAPFLLLRDVNRRLKPKDGENISERVEKAVGHLPVAADAERDAERNVPRVPGGNVDTARAAYAVYTAPASVQTDISPAAQTEWQDRLSAEIGVNLRRVGGIWLHGGVIAGMGNRVGRFYFSLHHGHAGVIWRALRQLEKILGLKGIAVQYKMGLHKAMYGRADPFVLYFNADHEEEILRAVVWLAGLFPEAFKESIPLFSAPVPDTDGHLLPGIGFGQNPSDPRQSFGGLRADAMTAANREIRDRLAGDEKVTVADAYAIMAFHLRRAGVDTEHPAFEKGGKDVFPLIFQRTKQASKF